LVKHFYFWYKYYSTVNKCYVIDNYHQAPDWMPPLFHICSEKICQFFNNNFVLRRIPYLWFPYAVFFGFICGYNMKEILEYLKRLGQND